MPKLFHVTCNLPNASNLINGIKFAAHETVADAVRTVDAVEVDVAAMFKGIKGYVIEDAAEVKKVETKAEKLAREAAEKADADAKAAEAGAGKLV